MAVPPESAEFPYKLTDMEITGRFVKPIDGVLTFHEGNPCVNLNPQIVIKALLKYIGEDPDRPGLVETPDRILKSWTEIFSGYKKKPEDVFKVFEDGANGYDEMVVLKDTELYSTCEHHWLPFVGKAHIAYVPNGKIVGLSKLARLLEVFSRRLQVQERITTQVTKALMDHLDPKGAACIIEATHMCMTCRGVLKQNSRMVTSSLEGVFRDDARAREELMMLIKG